MTWTVLFVVVQWKMMPKWSPTSRPTQHHSSQRPWNASSPTGIDTTVNMKTRRNSKFLFETWNLKAILLWWEMLLDSTLKQVVDQHPAMNSSLMVQSLLRLNSRVHSVCSFVICLVCRVSCTLICPLFAFTVWAAHVETNWKKEVDLNRLSWTPDVSWTLWKCLMNTSSFCGNARNYAWARRQSHLIVLHPMIILTVCFFALL